jgi:MFS transporter, Spinster family, sphingosine-1-phosphate transporter
VQVRGGPETVQYKNYLLAVLMVILTFNQMDGTALGILLQDIKTDLDLSDTQLGVLSGLAFAFFYSIMGIPIARWADRGNRIAIIALTTAVWSVAVALCGAAQNFAQLVATRVAVATGEAGCIPSAHSLIADHFTRTERPRAVARYMLGIPLALTIGYFAAGWLNTFFHWRMTFVVLGLPGLVLAFLAVLTLKEPRRARDNIAPTLSGSALQSTKDLKQPSMKEVCLTLWANRSFRNLLVCHSVWYFFGYGLLQWTPSFFIRSYGLHTGEIGTWFAGVYGLGGCLGVYVGGELATRYAAGRERLQLNACALAFISFGALHACAYLATDRYLAFALLALGAIGGNMVQGPLLATIQTLVPPQMRAMSVALTYLFANLIGMGLGPLATGVLSDALRPSFGQESLRYALLILCPGYFWAAWHLWRAGQTVLRDLKAAQVQDEARLAAAFQPRKGAGVSIDCGSSCERPIP